ncbi:MAG TPA: NADH-quinone oxidoreductase subunit M [Polyangiaceae bacterium]|nr:NADH-quinone oxidoreductase subunit M [Polyangiaceae bacterium]
MNSLLSLVSPLLPFLLPLALGIVAALVPRDARMKHRIGYAMVTFMLTAAVIALWPEATQKAVETTPAETKPEEWPHLLDVLIALPLAGGIAVLFLPRQMLSLVRGFTYGIFALTFIASLWLLSIDYAPGWHFVHMVPWIESAGIRWHVAIDGISLWLVLLTTFTTPIAAFASFASIRRGVKELCAVFLILEGAMIGSFVALDLFVFYVFWELMLVPMFLMIGVWGGADRIKAAIKFFVFTMTGSVLMLAAVLYLVWTHHELTGMWSFDYLDLAQVIVPGQLGIWGPQAACFWAFSLAFFVKVPMFPLHTWLPDAHTEAPTGGSVVLAAVMLKFGTYGYLRFSMGLFPGQATMYAPTLAGVAIMGGILYGALVAWKQPDVKRLVAYSSVAHLGFVMLGLFGATVSGIQGAILQMVNHGIATGGLFLLVGVIYDRRHTRDISEFGGIAKVMPVYAAVFLIVTMASIGVPGTNGFVGEFMIIAGTYVAERLNQFSSIQAVGAAFGVILAAVYMLTVVQQMFFGPLTNPKNKGLNDLTPREGLALAPLCLAIFVIGLFPGLLLNRMEPAVTAFRAQIVELSEIAKTDHVIPNRYTAARLAPGDKFGPGFLDGAPSLEAEKKKAEAEAPPAPPGQPGAPGAPPAPPGAPGMRPPGAMPPGAMPPGAPGQPGPGLAPPRGVAPPDGVRPPQRPGGAP